MSLEKHNYEVDLVWIKDRVGEISSPVLDTRIQVATPPEFDNGVEGIWSPEHLLVASVSSCFMTSFLAIADYSKFDYESLEVSATGTLEKILGKFMITQIVLKAVLGVSDEDKTDKAIRLLKKAEEVCLISRSIKSEVILKEEVKVLKSSLKV